MSQTPPTIARAQRTERAKMQEGILLSFTTIMHPPSGFGDHPRLIGLVALQDGSHVLAQLTAKEAKNLRIGQHVVPRMRLNSLTEQKLRSYAVCYEPVAESVILKKDFPGYILALTGPSGVGKTTVSTLLTTSIGKHAAQVPILTTRKPKKHDSKEEYRHINVEQFMALQKRGDIIAATKIPSETEERWYGYRATDIELIWNAGKIPIVITEMGLLQELSRHYGRRSVLSFGLLPPGKSKRTMLSHLLHRLRTRGRDTEENIAERIRNAEKDLQFFKEREELFDDLIVNENLETVISFLKGRVLELARG